MSFLIQDNTGDRGAWERGSNTKEMSLVVFEEVLSG